MVKVAKTEKQDQKNEKLVSKVKKALTQKKEDKKKYS